METLIFSFELLALAFLGFYFFQATSGNPLKIFINKQKIFSLSVIIINIIFIILSALDFVNFFSSNKLDGFHGVIAIISIITTLAVFALGKYDKHFVGTELKKFLIFTLRSFFVLCLIEIFIFNYKTYTILPSEYQQKTINLGDAVLTNADIENGTITANYIDGKQKPVIEINDINIPVQPIYFGTQLNENTQNAKIDVEFKDSAFSSYFRAAGAYIDLIKWDDRTQNMVCSFSGDVSALKLWVNVDEGCGLKLSNIVLNKPIPLDFSILRFGLIFLSILFLKFLLGTKMMKTPYNQNAKVCSTISTAMTVVLLVCAFAVVYAVSYKGADYSIDNDFKSKSGNQITQELVDAFEAGQVSLLDEPSEELLQLENPYDPSVRTISGADVKWDHVLYDGKYYSYYGIGPVLLLFLPYHLLTGYYFPTNWAILIFSVIGLVFLTKIYLQFIKKWHPKLPSNFVIMGLGMLHMTSGIWFSLIRPLFYEIAIASAFGLFTAGGYFLLSSNIVGGRDNDRISYWRLALSSILLSLSVLCRPTYAIYCIVAVIFIFMGIKKQKHQLLYAAAAAASASESIEDDDGQDYDIIDEDAVLKLSSDIPDEDFSDDNPPDIELNFNNGTISEEELESEVNEVFKARNGYSFESFRDDNSDEEDFDYESEDADEYDNDTEAFESDESDITDENSDLPNDDFGSADINLKRGQNVKSIPVISKRMAYVKYFMCALLPFVIIGGIQMLYNYIRFDSPLEFGIKYSLTINDFINSQYHTSFVFAGLINYLFTAPYFVYTFPFVNSNFQSLLLNGYYWVDDVSKNTISLGLFFKALPMFAYFLLPFVYKKLNKGERAEKGLLLLPFCIAAPLIIIFSIWESGYAIRYLADFSWQMLIGALAICFFIIMNHKKELFLKLYERIFAFFAVMCFWINFAQMYNFMYSFNLNIKIKALLESIGRLFEFWG